MKLQAPKDLIDPSSVSIEREAKTVRILIKQSLDAFVQHMFELTESFSKDLHSELRKRKYLSNV